MALQKEIMTVVPTGDDNYYDTMVTTMYAGSHWGDKSFQISISHPKQDIHQTITFRNVTRKNRNAAIQMSIETTKWYISGRTRTTLESFSIPAEMVDAFIEALKTDMSGE